MSATPTRRPSIRPRALAAVAAAAVLALAPACSSDDGDVPEGYYNSWKGFYVQPREGDCSSFLTHVKNIVCGGNDEHYNWLMDWLADLVQDPANPKGCSVILRGGEGCGKGTFCNAVGKEGY